MNRPRILCNGLRRLAFSPAARRSYITKADVDGARQYCAKELEKGDYDAHLIRRFAHPAQDMYTALRALNLELVRLPDIVSNPTIGLMRMKFWQESIDKTFAGQPPREPICILLHQALLSMEQHADAASKKSIKFWLSRLVRTREKHMDNRPFTNLAALEDYAENTYSTMMYATLASLGLRSMDVDHLASHIGKACGIVAVLRGVPLLAPPPAPIKTPSGDSPPTREPSLLLPLDVMAEEGVKEEEVFRQGPNAPGLQDAIFKVATRANDHLITAREMLKRLRAGEDAGHDFEHHGEGAHVYDEGESDRVRDLHRGFRVLLEAAPATYFLERLEQANFDPFTVKAAGWKLPWRVWQTLSKEQLQVPSDSTKTLRRVRDAPANLRVHSTYHFLSRISCFTKPSSDNDESSTHSRHHAIRINSCSTTRQGGRGQRNRQDRRFHDPPQRRCRARHRQLGRLRAAATRLGTPDEAPPRPLLCRALRCLGPAARRGPQHHAPRAAHDSLRPRQAGRREAGNALALRGAQVAHRARRGVKDDDGDENDRGIPMGQIKLDA